jgi:hypothetical protein
MRGMRSLFFTILTILLGGCTGATYAPKSATIPTAYVKTGGDPLGGFLGQDQRVAACLDVRDHIVDLYVGDYVQTHPEVTLETRQAFRDAWAEELARTGKFEDFEAVCFGQLTVAKYDCAMAVLATSAINDCMKK